jgi:DNA invertase Pin-like site-specific DNA recombinase
MRRLLALDDVGQVEMVMVHQRASLTRSVVDAGKFMEVFKRKLVALALLQGSLDDTESTGELMMNLVVHLALHDFLERRHDRPGNAKGQGGP